MSKSSTRGIHHLGLTVSNLEASAGFFIEHLGWKEVRRNNDYPAIFISDGTVMLTLWAAKILPVTEFDKNKNIGLHHLALAVESEAELQDIYQRLSAAGVEIEFAPELLRDGPAKHMMCYEPDGIRLEFIWPG